MARFKATLRRFIVADGGASVIEFALLLPVYLLLLTGMIAYAIYFGAAHSVQQIAADAARTSIAGIDSDERDTLVENFIDANAGDYLFIDRTEITYAIGESEDDPNQYDVTIAYDAADLPIWNLYLPLPLPDPVITFSSTIRHGGI